MQRGFTLIELVVAIAIAALLVGAIATNYARLQQAMEYRSVVREVLAGMRTARNEAQRSGRPVSFVVDLEQRSYGVSDHGFGRFPDSVDVRVTVASTEAFQRGRSAIRFLPQGGATGGSVDILRASSGEGVRLRVDWLLGHIEQEPVVR
ncbi:GspH/FimT family pseudopilin [Parazoarcus communis]|uniref:Type II secretion system protein H n=1 Tax=Parazoarcus communis SWub3 = DSM 12120 TaxID=1121029 RepID=A0A323UUH7_9RHOO|nr:GspH/FimT family pseudopilin [Parazoarcus communis]NMG70952.1 prepilin-type N-terminal cleavage/methylation domain-containing protein [Parazoarcus communis SWub3 = DSM 12120]PZA16164.1 type II secretion system protein GspH [Azoarcus communis] [Parazoarcus communis SWub3 = DSM 12120]